MQLGAVPGMGFAAHMSSLRDEDRETRELNALVAQPHMYKVPSALVSLPARRCVHKPAGWYLARPEPELCLVICIARTGDPGNCLDPQTLFSHFLWIVT